MTFNCRTYTSGNMWPCEPDFAIDPIETVSLSFVFGLVGLGFFALVYLLAARKGSA